MGPLGFCPHHTCVLPGPCTRTPALGQQPLPPRVSSNIHTIAAPSGLLTRQGQAQSSWPQVPPVHPPSQTCPCTRQTRRKWPCPDTGGHVYGGGLPSFPGETGGKGEGAAEMGRGMCVVPSGQLCPWYAGLCQAGSHPDHAFLCPTTERSPRGLALAAAGQNCL